MRRRAARQEEDTREQPGKPGPAGLSRRIRVCTECPLHASRTQAVPGEGEPQAKVIIIGEAPGPQEDQTGRPFVGSAGEILEGITSSKAPALNARISSSPIS